MSITYSGTVREVTSDIEDAIADLGAAREPESRAFRQGTIEVRPIDVEGHISGGSFNVTVDDKPDVLHGYRVLAAGELTDPCETSRNRAFQARRELDIAKRDGASQVEAKRRQLRLCREESSAPEPEPEPEPEPRTVPFVRELSQQVAAKRVRDIGLVPKFTGPTGPGTPFIFSQSPGPGARVPVGSTVNMGLRTGPIP